MVYFINYLIIPLYYAIIKIAVSDKNKVRKLFFFVILLHAVLFRALANPFNYVDTERYAVAFENISDMTFKEAVLSPNIYSEWGLGYVGLNWIISRLTSDYAYLFVILAILSVGGVMLYYYKTTTTPLTTVMLYLLYPMMYIMGFGVLRQHLAVVFILWGLYYMDNLKFSIPLAIMGILCHTSALVVVPFYLMRNINLQHFTLTKLISISAIGFYAITLSIAYVLSFISRYDTVLTNEGSQRNIVPVFMLGSLLFMFFFSGITNRVKDVKDGNIVRFLIYGFIIAIIGMTIPRGGRLTLYFIYVIPVAVSLLFKYSTVHLKWINKAYIVLLFALVSVLVYYSVDKYDVYKFYWEYVG